MGSANLARRGRGWYQRGMALDAECGIRADRNFSPRVLRTRLFGHRGGHRTTAHSPTWCGQGTPLEGHVDVDQRPR